MGSVILIRAPRRRGLDRAERSGRALQKAATEDLPEVRNSLSPVVNWFASSTWRCGIDPIPLLKFKKPER
jgi:hypothetical protein